MLLPLALAQFICSFAGSNLNVMINDIAADLGTTVAGVQLVITLFTLVMAALMIPGSKLTDIWGRKRCFIIGLGIYAVGALMSALATNLTILIIGNSILEGVGSALLIPPIYILLTVSFTDLRAQAKAFGVISAMCGIGAAAGPLIGGVIATSLSWRYSFILQLIVIILIMILARRIFDPGIKGPKPAFDILGAIAQALGLIFIVLGIQLSGQYGWLTSKKDLVIGGTVIIPEGSISPVWVCVGIGAIILVLFFVHIYFREKRGKEPLLSIRLFKNKTSNLGLTTQTVQWLILQGSFFVIAVYLQTVRGYSAIQTGLVLTASTAGILLSSFLSSRLVKKFSRRILIISGFVITALGTVLLLLLGSATGSIFLFLPGLFLIGVGIGVMLTFSVSIVQSAFPEKDQGEISGLSRAMSNLGSSLGVALVGSVLVTEFAPVNANYVYALIVMVVIGLIGLIASILLPRKPVQTVNNTD